MFEGSDKFFRDFVHIDDIVKINLFFLGKSETSGIFNCGCGIPNTFLRAAELVAKIYKCTIKPVPFPEKLKGRYQSFTKADLHLLRRIGYNHDFRKFDEALIEYANQLRV